MKKTLCASAVLVALLAGCNTTSPSNPAAAPATSWTLNTGNAISSTAVDVSTSTISGGPWVLAQGAGNYCAANGKPYIGTPGSATSSTTNGSASISGGLAMAPYAGASVIGIGYALQGFFDYRPYGVNEGIVAAKSLDGGLTWSFQQMVLNQNQSCPVGGFNPAGSDQGDTNPYVLTVSGQAYMYTMDSSAANSNFSEGLVLNPLGFTTTQLAAQQTAPLQAVNQTQFTIPASNLQSHTVGLINPVGILAVVPGSSPTRVLYISKQIGADNTGATAMPAASQCTNLPVAPAGGTVGQANHDIVTVRNASTTDGINFVDLGAIYSSQNPAPSTVTSPSYLMDPTTTSYTGIRYIGTNGTILRINSTTYGLFFSGGNCMDDNSDGQHFIGYAESTDLVDWTVINGPANPIASIAPVTAMVNGVSTTIPSTTPVAGTAQSWFAGRVGSPQANQFDTTNVLLTISGSAINLPVGAANISSPPNLTSYRQIGNIQIHSNNTLPTPYVY